jgi:hypothetical protein
VSPEEIIQLGIIPKDLCEKLALYKDLCRYEEETAREEYEKQCIKARVDPAFFIEFCIPHEKTNAPITNAEFHREWQEFLSSTRAGVIFAPVEHGKSTQISVGRILWELGNDPTLRILLISRTKGQAKKAIGFIKYQIVHNKKLHDVFPNLRKSTKSGMPWNESDITVERAGASRDPSVQARGEGSEDILGSRLDLVVYDDGLTLDNTRTKEARDKHEDWFDTVVYSRLVEDYEDEIFGRIFAIGTPFNEDDQLHRLSKRKGWKVKKYCCVLNPEDPTNKWKPLWPRQWPLIRILDKRESMTISAFTRTLLCQVLDASVRRFKRPWIEFSKLLGRGRTFLQRVPTYNGEPMKCFTGIDIGVGKKDSDALTTAFTWAVDPYGRRIIVDIESGHLTGPEIINLAWRKRRMFDSKIGVESNAAQKLLTDFPLDGEDTFAEPLNTGSEKWDDELGVESLAILMKSGRIVVPSGEDGQSVPPEADAWLTECWQFDPSQHTGDRLMASWIGDKMVREHLEEMFDYGTNYMDR